MDGYPDEWAPPLDHDRKPAVSFSQWWPNVHHVWPHVPEEVAREWLYRHWGQSPFSHIKSADYHFERQTWDASAIRTLTYRMNDFRSDNLDAYMAARYETLMEAHGMTKAGLWLVSYMHSAGDFPSPPVVIDNRDGHMIDHQYGYPDYYPHGYLLVEGHTRFEIAWELHRQGHLVPQVDFFVMTRD